MRRAIPSRLARLALLLVSMLGEQMGKPGFQQAGAL